MTNYPLELSIDRLQFLCDTIPAKLTAIDEDAFSNSTAPGKWSKKEIIGHLIDSATVNHHRLVRGQFEHEPLIPYDPDAWNACGHYWAMDSHQVIAFWTAYNQHLVALLRIMPGPAFLKQVDTGGATPHSISFLVHDYVAHLEHHLRQVVIY